MATQMSIDYTWNCRCGCGKQRAAGRSFAPGHDLKAVMNVIKERYDGDITHFLDHHGM